MSESLLTVSKFKNDIDKIVTCGHNYDTIPNTDDIDQFLFASLAYEDDDGYIGYSDVKIDNKLIEHVQYMHRKFLHDDIYGAQLIHRLLYDNMEHGKR